MMNPRLLAISGPLSGNTITITDNFSIGRDNDCTLSIKQSSVSRLHCRIEKIDEEFIILDLSRHGTSVNQITVKQQMLRHGDQIDLGGNSFLFLIETNQTPLEIQEVVFEDSDYLTQPNLTLRKEDALYLNREKLITDKGPQARTVRDLHAILSCIADLGTYRNVQSLQSGLLKTILEIVPANRGVIILMKDSMEEITSLFAMDCYGESQPISVSKTVIQQVLSSRAAILCNDVAASDPLKGASSLATERTESLLCVPLLDGTRVNGMIYLAYCQGKSLFDERHLELVTAIASIATVALENVSRIEWLKEEKARLEEELSLGQEMVGNSPKMRELFQLIAKVSSADSSVLIQGESGTGKELVARAIHANSERTDAAFVAVNCAALVDTLLETELFGHEKGAFTGAVVQKKGRIEVADGGTLFLDEVGELKPSLQAKLLRVLQERTFERVGGIRPIKANIRVIAATNKNLREAVARREFREDLYFRLNVIEINLPPLRERPEDIPALARYFVAKYAAKCKRQVDGLSLEAYACLISYGWPGNVRELENAIERAIVLGSDQMVTQLDLPQSLHINGIFDNRSAPGFYESLKSIKKQLILNAFQSVGGNHNDAAKVLNIHPNNLHRLLRNLELNIR